MAILSITPANVVPGTGAVTVSGTYGETVTAGQCVYKNSTDSEFYLAECDSTSAKAECYGIALNSGSNGQPASVLTKGSVTIGATVAVGVVYVVASAAGGIAPTTDLASTNYVSVLAVGDSTATLKVSINNSGIQKA